MQAVILAGGLGTRLWPLTKEIPKPMAPVAGAPYLAHQLRYLKAHDITNIVMLTGYLGEQIESYFGDGAEWGLTIAYSREPAPIGTGGALREAAGLLEPEFLVIYGDSFLPIDYAQVLLKVLNSTALAAVAVYDNSVADTSVRNNIALDAFNFVTRYDKDAQDDADLRFVEAGVLALKRPVIDLIPPGVVSLEKDIFPVLIKQSQLLAFPTTQRFYDIGTPERLKAIEDFLKHDHHADSI